MAPRPSVTAWQAFDARWRGGWSCRSRSWRWRLSSHPGRCWGLLAYPLQVLRLSRRGGWTWATFVTLGKFAEAQGALAYWWRRLARRRAQLIEYK